MVSTTRSTIYPKDCTFTHSDWDALAAFWYPIAISGIVTRVVLTKAARLTPVQQIHRKQSSIPDSRPGADGASRHR
jgi:hypothetical protein